MNPKFQKKTVVVVKFIFYYYIFFLKVAIIFIIIVNISLYPKKAQLGKDPSTANDAPEALCRLLVTTVVQLSLTAIAKLDFMTPGTHVSHTNWATLAAIMIVMKYI